MSDFVRLKEEAIRLDYPPNYSFNVETLEPTGDLAHRVKCLEETAPEMMQGGKDWSFFDLGSNKGFLPIHLRDKYKELCGWEPDGRYVKFSKDLKAVHKISNIFYAIGRWQDMYSALCTDVVYCGGVHHHGFNDCVKDNRLISNFMTTVAGAARQYLIIDGPWHLDNPDHNTAGSLARTHKWSDKQRSCYNIKTHAEWIVNNFDLIRSGPSGTGDRKIAVFKRR